MNACLAMSEIVAKAGCVYIIGDCHRPGTTTFASELEHQYYLPDTELNEFYDLHVVKYAKDMMFFVIEITTGKYMTKSKLDTLANRNNLKLVYGKPYDGVNEFPIKCLPEHCFTLETRKHQELNRDIAEALEKEYRDNLLKYDKSDQQDTEN